MAPRPYSRAYHRFPLFYPVIFGGAPFVGEGLLTNLSSDGMLRHERSRGPLRQ